MALIPGTRLGPYEIQAPLGAGGMGEVYKAADTRLGRLVAIKVLPAHVSDDPQLRQRFEREAKTLATLSHPHICPVFDVGSQNGTDFLVMEYLDGETLSHRLQKGGVSLDQALKYAIEIADALDKAHGQGIVHRDLKPGNIMLTRSGVKLLDFGLAKVRPASPPGSVAVSGAPTVSSPLTGQGSIVGTFQYMAPEQLEGQEADARSDIFAFGAVVFEMVTGRRAFHGTSQASVISAILRDDPRPISSSQPAAPPALDHVIGTCLAKDPEQRWRSAGDVGLQLQWILNTHPTSDVRAVAASRRSRWRIALPIAAGALGAGLLAVVLVPTLTRSADPHPVRFAVSVRSMGWQDNANGPALLALAPDGRTMVYAGRNQLYRRDVGQLGLEPIGGTGTGGDIDNINTPFFSPDGQWLGYWLAGTIKKVPRAGGSPVTVINVVPRGVSWGPGDMVVFGSNEGLMRVSANGGEPERVTSLDTGEVGHYRPDILPGGEGVLFTAWSGSLETAQIAVVSLRTGERRNLMRGTYPRYTSTGHIVFAREDSLWAVPFDIGRLQVTGTAGPVVNGVRVEPTSGVAQFAIGGDGSLLYATSGTQTAAQRLVWVDREGREEPLPLEPGPYSEQRLSPDGTRVALTVAGGNVDVWIFHLARRTLTRLTFDDGPDRAPLWTRDGSRVVFQSSQDGGGLFWKAADGTGQVERLLKNPNRPVARSWSADGRLIFDTVAPGARDVGILRIDNTGTDMLLNAPQYYEQSAALSPDGRWLAYQSDESGRSEVYVRPFPDVNAGKWQVSTSGGGEPGWSPDGQELYYRGAGSLMVARAQTTSSFSTSTPEALLSTRNYTLGTLARGYDVSPDGRRFLMLKPEPGSSNAETAPDLIFVQHWSDELRRLVPAQ